MGPVLQLKRGMLFIWHQWTTLYRELEVESDSTQVQGPALRISTRMSIHHQCRRSREPMLATTCRKAGTCLPAFVLSRSAILAQDG